MPDLETKEEKGGGSELRVYGVGMCREVLGTKEEDKPFNEKYGNI